MNLGRIIIYSVVVIIAVFLISTRWIYSQAKFYQGEVGPQLREELSFSHGSPYIRSGGDRIEVFMIYPEPNGFMQDVGFNMGDIIISESITGFYKLLYESRGKKVSIEAVSGGDGPPIADRETKSLTFLVPDRSNSNSE